MDGKCSPISLDEILHDMEIKSNARVKHILETEVISFFPPNINLTVCLNFIKTVAFSFKQED